MTDLDLSRAFWQSLPLENSEGGGLSERHLRFLGEANLCDPAGVHRFLIQSILDGAGSKRVLEYWRSIEPRYLLGLIEAIKTNDGLWNEKVVMSSALTSEITSSSPLDYEVTKELLGAMRNIPNLPWKVCLLYLEKGRETLGNESIDTLLSLVVGDPNLPASDRLSAFCNLARANPGILPGKPYLCNGDTYGVLFSPVKLGVFLNSLPTQEHHRVFDALGWPTAPEALQSLLLALQMGTDLCQAHIALAQSTQGSEQSINSMLVRALRDAPPSQKNNILVLWVMAKTNSLLSVVERAISLEV